MANNGKFLTEESGRIKQEQGVNTSAGAGDADKLARLDASGRWSSTMLPVGVGVDVRSIQASENIAAGDFVNIHNSVGLRVRRADATASGKEANGFVLAGILSGASGDVYSLDGVNSQVTGRTIGARQYLSAATPGGVVETPPSASGNVVQYLGMAVSATEIIVESYDGIILV